MYNVGMYNNNNATNEKMKILHDHPIRKFFACSFVKHLN